jgi:hypothetical protein
MATAPLAMATAAPGPDTCSTTIPTSQLHILVFGYAQSWPSPRNGAGPPRKVSTVDADGVPGARVLRGLGFC